MINAGTKENPYVIPSDFTRRYKDEIEKINIHEALSQALLVLKEKYLISVVSSTSDDLISHFLKKEKILDYFSDILGVDVNANKTIKVNHLLEKYNLNPEDAVFVTDTLGDIREAEKSGVKSIGVTWGLHERKNLERGNPVAIIDNPLDLLKTIENVLK